MRLGRSYSRRRGCVSRRDELKKSDEANVNCERVGLATAPVVVIHCDV